MSRPGSRQIRPHRLDPRLTAADVPRPCAGRFMPGAPALPDAALYRLCRTGARPGLPALVAPLSGSGI